LAATVSNAVRRPGVGSACTADRRHAEPNGAAPATVAQHRDLRRVRSRRRAAPQNSQKPSNDHQRDRLN